MKQLLCRLLALGLLLAVTGKAPSQPAYTYSTLDVPGSVFTSASGINDAGQIVGHSSTSVLAFTNHGFLYSGGSYTTIDVPSAVETYANAINGSGQIVGSYDSGRFGVVHGYLLSGGSFTTIDLPGSRGTEAYGINASGQIIGYPGFLLSGNSFTTLSVPGSFLSGTYAYGINALGQVVGKYEDIKADFHGFLYSGGSYTTLDVPGAAFTTANGINDAGQIVGFARGRGFLLSGGSYLTLDFPGATETEAYGINNAGQIVGAYIDSAGHQHGFLATPSLAPVPEPSALVLLTCATLSLIGYGWWSRKPAKVSTGHVCE